MIVALVSIGTWCRCQADTCPIGNGSMLDVDAAAMVRAVRESEQWIHQVDSMVLRVESVWSHAAESSWRGLPALASRGHLGLASSDCDQAEAAEVQGQDALATKTKGGTPSPQGLLEYAFDRRRLRFLEDQPDESHSLRIWDGKQFIGQEAQAGRREQYLLDATSEGNFDDILASETAWPRSQPHAFWWDLKDADTLAVFFGRPEEFKCVARENYRDTDCHVLEMRPTEVRAILHGESYGCDAGLQDQQEHGRIGEVRGLVDQSCRWYVGVEDGRLRGITWLITERPRLEHWMSDYRQVAPGWWYPMTQGYQVYNKDKEDRAYVERRRDLKVVEIKVNEPLADDLFRLQIPEGARVQDRRSGRLVTYDYKPEPADMLGKPLPPLDQMFTQLDPASRGTGMGTPNAEFCVGDPFQPVIPDSWAGCPCHFEGQAVLLCFWDFHQRPSRHCIRQLVQRAQQQGGTGVTIVTIQTANVEPPVLNRWVQEYSIPFPVLVPTDSFDKIRLAWNIRSLPWLILADRSHVVRALGFSVEELDTQLTAVTEQPGPWIAASQ